MIKRNSSVPLYVQLADTIRGQIKTGQIKVGDMLPSENEMIKLYGVARLTVREALSVLVNEGLLEKRHGKGTFCRSSLNLKKIRVDIFLNLAEVDFIPYYLRSICEVLESENVNVVMADTKNDADVIAGLIENAMLDKTDGIIFQPSNRSENAPDNLVSTLSRLVAHGIPYVMIDTFYKNLPESYVVMDEFQAGRISADYFKSLGIKKACAVTYLERTDSKERLDGFFSSFGESTFFLEYTESFAESLSALIKKHSIDGIFCFNDGVAKKCYDILAPLNVRIPDDVSIISVDDTVIASTLSPALTSVIHPKENLGRDAARAILSMISKELEWPYKKVFQPSLAIRKSTKGL
ncbi:MAG: substrate-binding domain-containing protein [Clostridia bacterium]|nr:substrate-binding domain-containing protein [Clostridia bacterium]